MKHKICMKIHDEKGLTKTILKWPPTRLHRKIFDGPISKSAYNTFLNTYTKFYHKVHNFFTMPPHYLQSKMKINFKKSLVMWLRVSNRSAGISYPPISIDGIELTVTEKQKYLGHIFDCNLSWTHHIANVCSKMSYYLYLLSTHHHVIDYNLMKLLLEYLVLSHLSYCVTVWGPSLRSILLQRLQRM